jgi:hypothetical protein
MRTEIRLEHIQQEYEFRKDALEGFRKQAKETRQQEFYRIKTSLNPCGYDDTLYRFHGLRCREAGEWLFNNETYTKWFNSFQGESRILWLKGIPGAGERIHTPPPTPNSQPGFQPDGQVSQKVQATLVTQI